MKSEINPPPPTPCTPLPPACAAPTINCLAKLLFASTGAENRPGDQELKTYRPSKGQLEVNPKCRKGEGEGGKVRELKSLLSLVRNFPCRFEDKSLSIKNAQSRAVETPPTRLLIKPLSLPTRVKLFPYFDFTRPVSILLFKLLLLGWRESFSLELPSLKPVVFRPLTLRPS